MVVLRQGIGVQRDTQRQWQWRPLFSHGWSSKTSLLFPPPLGFGRPMIPEMVSLRARRLGSRSLIVWRYCWSPSLLSYLCEPGVGIVSWVVARLRSASSRPSGFSSSVTGTIPLRRPSSCAWWTDRERRLAARADGDAPSPLSSESATNALRDEDKGGRRGPGTGRSREILPRAERVRNPSAAGDASSEPKPVGLTAAGSWGMLCMVEDSRLAGTERVRPPGFDVAGVKNDVEPDPESDCWRAPSWGV